MPWAVYWPIVSPQCMKYNANGDHHVDKGTMCGTRLPMIKVTLWLLAPSQPFRSLRFQLCPTNLLAFRFRTASKLSSYLSYLANQALTPHIHLAMDFFTTLFADADASLTDGSNSTPFEASVESIINEIPLDEDSRSPRTPGIFCTIS